MMSANPPARLTLTSPGGGCACKLPQATLGDVLDIVRTTAAGTTDRDLLVGLSKPDDAAVYAIDENDAWVITTDFITPVVDDPYDWGRVAAANAFSDIYAMGGQPFLALNLLCWPDARSRTELAEVLRGGSDVIAAAGAVIVGGHSIRDPVPKYGLVAIGRVDRRELLTKGGGRAGDQLILTKSIGVGAIGTATKHGAASPHAIAAAVASMTQLNDAARVAQDHHLRGGTDITGYGLIGHVHEMARAAGLTATIFADRVPSIPTALALIEAGYAPDGSRRTLANAQADGWFDAGGLGETQALFLADAQTSGGLLLAVPPGKVDAVLATLHTAGMEVAMVVAELADGPAGAVRATAGAS